MRFLGSRRARGIILALVAVLAFVLWRASRLYAESVLRNLGPTLITQLEERLQRKISVDRLVLDRPGSILAEGVTISQGRTLDSGVLLRLQRAELTYNPLLLSWSSVWTRGAGQDTRARIRVTGLEVPGPQGLPVLTSGRPLLTASSVQSDFDLGPLLRGSGDVLPTVRRVEIDQPRFAALRRRDGTWDLEQHLKGHDRGFRGDVVATRAVIELRDQAAGSFKTLQKHQLTGDFTLQFAAAPLMRFTASGRAMTPEPASFRASGTRDSKSKRWFASIEADTDRMAYWYRYFVKNPKGTDVLAGSARVAGVVWDDHPEPGSEAEFRIELDVRGGAARVQGIPAPFQDFNGRIDSQKELLTLAGTATLGGNPLRLSGDVLIGPRGHANWSFTSEQVDLVRLQRAFPELKLPEGLQVRSPLSLRALVSGGGEDDTWAAQGEITTRDVRYREVRSPGARVTFQGRFGKSMDAEFTGGFHLDTVRSEDLSLSALAGQFSWRQNLIEASGSFSALGGSGSVRGWAELPETGETRLYATGRIKDLQLGRIPRQPRGVEISGAGAAEFIVSGTAEKPEISAFVRGTGLTVNGQGLEELAARIRVQDELLHVEEATLRDPRGEATVSGTLGKEQTLDLQVSAQGLDLARLLGPEARVVGTAYGIARITGTVERPQAAGGLKIYQPRFGEMAADLAAADFTASDNSVQLSALKLIRAPETLTSERIELSRASAERPWQVAGEVQVEGLTLGRALVLARVDEQQRKEWPVSGSVDALKLQLSGELEKPLVQFSASVRDGAVRGIDLARLEASGRLDLGTRRLDLTSASAASSLGQLSASGVLELPEDLSKVQEGARGSLRFRAEGLPLARLVAEYQPQVLEYARVHGVAEVRGAVTGTLANSELALDRVRLEELVVNGAPVKLEPLKVTVLDDTLIVRDLRATSGSGELAIDYVGIGKRPGARAGELAQVVLGPLTARQMPLRLMLGLAEASPALDERQRDWIGVFDRWAERHGVLTASVGAAEDRPTDAQIRERLAGRAPAPSLAGEARIEGLRPVAGLGAAATLHARFERRPDRFQLNELVLSQTDGINVTASGRTEGADPRSASLSYTIRVQGLDLALADQIPDREVAARIAPLLPLRGFVNVAAEVSGTQAQPAVTLSGDVREPVVAGLPLDRVTLRDAVYRADRSRLTVGSVVLVKRPSPGAPEATLKLAGYLPVTWPELAIPGNEQRDLTVSFARQPLSVLNALASDADRLARRLDYELPAGRERLTRILGQILAPEGSIEGTVRLAGTANVPNNTGSLSVASESVRLRGLGPAVKREGWHLPGWLAEEMAGAEPLETSIDGFRLRVDLAGNAVRLSELTGRSSHGGSFSGRGEVKLGRDVNGGPAARVNLHLALAGFRISEKDAGRALGAAYRGTQFKTTLTSVRPRESEVPQELSITGDWPEVAVRGGIRLDDATLPLALDTPEAGTAPALPDNVELNLAVLPGKEVWIRNQLVRLQLEPPGSATVGQGEGVLRLTNRLSAPVVQGTLRASHGVFNLPLIRLRNGEGLIRVAYDGRNTELSTIRPSPVYVDLTAETTLRIQRAPNVEAEYYDATFEIRGSPGPRGAAGIRTAGVETGLAFGAEGGLNVTVRTEPPLPSSQIEALIRQQYVAEGFGSGGANVVEALRGQIEQAFAVNVASELTGRLEDKVRSFLGLSLFSVDLGISQPLRVRLGKRLFGPVYGTLTQQFGAPEDRVQRRYEVYYRVSPQFRVGYRQEQPLNQSTIFFSGSVSF